MKKLRYGDILFIDLGTNTGSEQNKKRPCVVLSVHPENETLTVIPIASKHKSLITHVSITERDIFYPHYLETKQTVIGSILCEHITTVHESQILSDVFCHLRTVTKNFLRKTIKKSVGLENYYNFSNLENKEVKNIISVDDLNHDIEFENKEVMIKRGQQILVNFGENHTVFKGMQKCVVISPNYANEHSKTLIVAPIVEGINENSFIVNSNESINFNFIKAIDKKRIVEVGNIVNNINIMDFAIENALPVRVLFEYKVLTGLIKENKIHDVIII